MSKKVDSRGMPTRTYDTHRRVASTSFAAVLLIVVGVFHLVQGFAALFSDGDFTTAKGYFLGSDGSKWGWAHLALGVAAVAAGCRAAPAGRLGARCGGARRHREHVRGLPVDPVQPGRRARDPRARLLRDVGGVRRPRPQRAVTASAARVIGHHGLDGALGPARRHGPVHRCRRGAPAPRAGRAAGHRRRPRRPDRARRGVDRVVRGAGVRRAVRDAVAHRGAPLPRRRGAAGRQTRVRRGIRRGHGHPARGARRGRRGARLGRGVRRRGGRRPRGGGAPHPGRRAGRDRPALQRRHRRHQGAGQDRHRVRQAAGHLPADPGHLVPGDGGAADRRPVGRRGRASRSG